jgi:hypothetical protein
MVPGQPPRGALELFWLLSMSLRGSYGSLKFGFPELKCTFLAKQGNFIINAILSEKKVSLSSCQDYNCLIEMYG